MIDKPGRPITVMHGTPPDGRPPNFTNCPPVVAVHVASDNDWAREVGTWPKHNGEFYSALIDTGADGIFIRPHVADAINAKLEGNGILSGFGRSRSGIQGAPIQIIFPQANFAYCCQRAVVADLFGDSRSFDLVLGREFLKNCQFFVDGPNRAYRLQWAGPST